MNRLHLYISLALFLLVCASVKQEVSAAQIKDSIADKMIYKGIDLIIRQDYSNARKHFTRIAEESPYLPLGYIYSAAVEIARSVDYEDEFNDKKIEFYIRKAESLSDSLLGTADNLEHNYYMALSKGYRAYYSAIKGSYVKAFSAGLESLKYYEKCLKFDKNFYESYIAIGTYNYWKSEKTDMLNWLPFFDDKREEGIKLLENAADKRTHNNYLTLYSLAWIYINKKEYSKTIKITENILEDYPGSRFFMWVLARAYEESNKKKAIALYKQIYDSYPPEAGDNIINRITLKHKIAMLEVSIGNKKEALSLCNDVLAIRINDDRIKEKISSRLSRVKELKEELTD